MLMNIKVVIEMHLIRIHMNLYEQDLRTDVNEPLFKN
jgi:hypothetical protein